MASTHTEMTATNTTNNLSKRIFIFVCTPPLTHTTSDHKSQCPLAGLTEADMDNSSIVIMALCFIIVIINV